MTTLSELNALRIANGKTELKAWKSSREKLEAAIQAETPADKTDPSMPMGENGNELVDELPNQPAYYFQMSQEELDQQTDRPKDEPQTDQTEQPSDLSDVEGQTETTEPAAELPLIPRGAIGAMSIELLTASDEPYESIVAKIVAKYPTAKTTARSLASIAMDLRRDGVEVPSRRKPAKAKVQAQEAPAGE